MGWKIYWAISLLLFLFGEFSFVTHLATQPLLAWVNLPFDTLALVGLFGFAFQKTLLRPWVWQGFWRTYIALFAVNVGQMYSHAATKPINGLAMAVAVALMLTIYAPTAYALRLYDQRIAKTPRPA